MDNSCVIGFGTVGKATALAFGIKKYFSRSDANITLEEASRCKYIFLCLPTPCINGRYFTDDLYEIIKQIESFPNTSDRVLVVRSTVYPGFCKHIQDSFVIDNVVFNPEFLSEDTWEADAVQPDLVVVGGNERYAPLVSGIYQARFKYLKPLVTDSTTAELIKLSLNNFFATKVAFANELFDYAQKAGANYEVIKGVLEGHRWGSKNHFEVFYKGKRGIHGKCLPKDLNALTNLTNSDFFKAVLAVKEKHG